MLSKELSHTLFTLFVLPHSELTAREELGCQDGRDAAHPQRLPSFVEILDDLF